MDNGDFDISGVWLNKRYFVNIAHNTKTNEIKAKLLIFDRDMNIKKKINMRHVSQIKDIKDIKNIEIDGERYSIDSINNSSS